MTSNVLMPKATAVWLIENTSLAFNQIAAFCGLHPLEVQGIANEDVAKGIRGVDPIAGGFLSREEIAKGEKDESYELKPLEQKRIDLPQVKKRGARYTPIARRQDRPDAIAWFLKNHPEVADSKIVKLIGTTKSTSEPVRNRTHWNSNQIKPVDPVTIGLCTQVVRVGGVSDAAVATARADARAAKAEAKTLKAAQDTVPAETYEPAATSEDNS
jgi:hypothetical protein